MHVHALLLVLSATPTISFDDSVSGLRATKATGTMRARPEQILSALVDVESHRTWMPRVTMSRVVRMLGGTQRAKLCYTRFVFPFPVGERDQVTTLRVVVDERDRKVQSWDSVPDELPLSGDIQRITNTRGTWTIVSSSAGSDVLYESTVDRPPLPGLLLDRAARSELESLWEALEAEALRR